MPSYDSFDVEMLMQEMTSEQRRRFHREMADTWKDPKTAERLRCWLGAIGAHHFYLRDYGRGLKYLFFFWTGVPAWLSLFERNIKRRTEQANRKVGKEIAAKIRRATPVVNQTSDLAYKRPRNFILGGRRRR